MSSKSGNRQEGHPSNVPLEDWKIGRVLPPSSWQIMKSWNHLTQAFKFQYFLHWFSLSKTSEASSVFPRLLTLLVSTQLLLSPTQSDGRGDWLSTLYIQRRPVILGQGGKSPLSETAPFFARCWMHSQGGQHPTKNYPKPLLAAGFTFISMWVISSTLSFYQV